MKRLPTEVGPAWRIARDLVMMNVVLLFWFTLERYSSFYFQQNVVLFNHITFPKAAYSSFFRLKETGTRIIIYIIHITHRDRDTKRKLTNEMISWPVQRADEITYSKLYTNNDTIM